MHWSWINIVAAPVGQSVAEAIWLYAYMLVLTPPTETPPGLGAVIALLALGTLAGLGARRLPWRYPRNYLMLPPVSLVVLPAWVLSQGSNPATILVVGTLAAVLWLRG